MYLGTIVKIVKEVELKKERKKRGGRMNQVTSGRCLGSVFGLWYVYRKRESVCVCTCMCVCVRMVYIKCRNSDPIFTKVGTGMYCKSHHLQYLPTNIRT